MTQRIKKPFLFLLSFLGLFLPFYQVWAIGPIIGTYVANYLASLTVNLALALSNLFLGLACGILNWVTGETFIAWSYTNPAKNPIIGVGWMLTRDLMNMFFVIILAFIGLATALRWKEYQAQKTLLKLIAMALLINFTPVICGLIVDASNIVTNFFLEKFAGWDILRQRFAAQGQNIRNTLGAWWNPVKMSEETLQALIMTAFNLFASMLLLLFAFLFAARYIALWLLVILSPVAFSSYILPLTRSFWKKWWSWFFQWSMVGVFAAFFLYLGNHMLLKAETMIQPPPPEIGGLASVWIEFLNTILPYGIATGFLGIGLLISLHTSAIGANYVIKGAKITGAVTVKTAKQRGKRFLRENVPPPIKRQVAKLATIKPPSWLEVRPEEKRSWYKRAGKAIGRAILTPAPALTALRKIGETALPETELKEIEEEKKRMEKFETPERLYKEFLQAGTRVGRIAALLVAHEKGWKGKLEKLGLTKENIITTGMDAFDIGPQAGKPLIKAYPKLAAEMASFVSEQAKETAGISESKIIEWAKDNLPEFTEEQVRAQMKELIPMKITAELGPKDIEKADLSYLNKEAIHRFWSGREISKAAQTFGREFVDEFMEEAEKKGVDWYLEHNPKVLLYLSGTAAQDLGFRPLEGMEAKEIRERIKLARMSDEALVRELRAISERAEELAKLPPEEIVKYEKEIEPIEKEIQRRERFRTPPPAHAAPTAPTAPTAPPEEEEEKWRDRHIGRIPSEKEEE